MSKRDPGKHRCVMARELQKRRYRQQRIEPKKRDFEPCHICGAENSHGQTYSAGWWFCDCGKMEKCE